MCKRKGWSRDAPASFAFKESGTLERDGHQADDGIVGACAKSERAQLFAGIEGQMEDRCGLFW